ncbi:MAG: PmoA family protein, partial [Flavobacteriaceae bacterium]
MAILGITMSSCEGQPKTAEAESASVVFVNDTANQKIDVQLNGTLFTSYHYQASLPKPVLFPLVTASGKTLTRGFPIDPQPGERVDHPHHMGHWFNYGDVNGLDFWNNSDAIPEEKLENYGKIVHSEIVKINQEEGSLITKSSWQNIAGESLLDETTVFKFSQEGNTRVVDRYTTLTALEDISFKDNKEGVFGVRVTRAMELPAKKPAIFVDAQGNPTEVKVLDNTGVNGNYLSSEGLEGNDVWGTRAEWVKLYSTINEEPVSITILDHPKNVGYPTYWHARDYGLFSANPLGQEVFSKGKEALNFSLQNGESVTFHYRMLVHNGSVLDPKDISKFSLVDNKYKTYFDGSDLSQWVIKTRRGEADGVIVKEIDLNDNIWWTVEDNL